MQLFKGLNDTMDIFAFKWRMFPGRGARAALMFGSAAVLFLVFMTASVGTFVKQYVGSLSADDQGRDTFLVFLKVFIDNNSGFMFGGMMWAMLLSAVVMPLIGFSFGSIVPEGDLVSVKRNSNHKISDSIFLQMVSSISIVQILGVTGLVSLFTVDSVSPGYAIIASWGLWLVATLVASLSTWFFELLLRKFGVKSKMVTVGVLAVVVLVLVLTIPTEALSFFGLAPMFVDFVVGLDVGSLGAFLGWCGLVVVACFVLLSLISVVASKALSLPEPPSKKDVNVTFFARIGLEERNFVSSVTQFVTNMILQQPNVLKPLLIGFSFTLVISVVFSAFASALSSVSVLIPVMVSLAWTINVFGVFGSGTTWLLSLPKAKASLLGAVLKVHVFVSLFIALVVGTVVTLVYGLPVTDLVGFVLASMAAALVVGQTSLKQSVYSPYRFRVNIKGESIIPPTKAISSMFRLFVFGFVAAGLVQAAGMLPVLPVLAQVAVFLGVVVFCAMKYVKLQRDWMNNNEVVQNIIKSVGVS